MICALLARKYHTCGTVKNYNNDIGLPVTIGKSDPDCEMLVLEMGMNHFGEMRQLTAIGRPDTVLITNIGSMHIRKSRLPGGHPQGEAGDSGRDCSPGGTAMFNGDEPLLWNLREHPVCKTMYFGIEIPDCARAGWILG